jgi:hypothetical protein
MLYPKVDFPLQLAAEIFEFSNGISDSLSITILLNPVNLAVGIAQDGEQLRPLRIIGLESNELDCLMAHWRRAEWLGGVKAATAGD